jgi:putative sigma-54 modulation protein
MKVSVHAVNTVDKAVDFVQDRMDKLEKYYDKSGIRCFFEG